MTKTILVLGRNGQVAHELAKLGPPEGYDFVFSGRADFDLSTRDDVEALIETHTPAAVINAAAYTAVDKAESERDAAFRLNGAVPGALARACAARDIPFVHISTDYVFAGDKDGPYVEDDPIDPQGAYGASKAEGERQVAAAGGRWAILRTAWVYSAQGANFVKTMRRLAESKDELGVVADQIGNPTWAEDCARAAVHVALKLIERDPRAVGVFHVAGAEPASWADFAEAIFAENAARGFNAPKVNRITSDQFPTPTKRPANSRLDCSKIERDLGLSMRPWRESLKACFDELTEASPQ